MMESLQKIVFSPTGGTQRVVNKLAEGIANTSSVVGEIDLADPFIDDSNIEVEGGSLAIIATPCFGGRVPVVAMERLSRIKGNGAQAVVVVVYGNRAFDDALLELEHGAEDAGFEVIACIAAIAEHSIMHQFATGRPDAEDDRVLLGFAKAIRERLEGIEPSKFTLPEVPGNEPYIKAGSVPLVPKITGRCTSCGECAKRCPVTAINTIDYGADKQLCISCMRCIQVCPQQARSVSKMMVKAASLAIKKAASNRKEYELFI